MDPVSHVALGVGLGTLAAGRPPVRRAAAAAVVGSLVPDLDAVVMPFGWDRYLRIHEIGTHSIAGIAAMAVVAALLVRRDRQARDWRIVLYAAALGTAGHVLLDLVSSARIRVLWPFLDRQFSIPIVAMADPWLGAILLAGALAIWLLPLHRPRAAQAALALAVLFLAVKGAAGWQAVRQYRAAAAADGVTTALVEARWASLDEWHVFDRTGDRLRTWVATPRSAAIAWSWPVRRPSPLESASEGLPAVRNFLRVHPLTFPVTLGEGGDRAVLWSDLRFCWLAANADSPRLEPHVPAPGGADLSCAVWVGSDVDGSGAPLRQRVHIFGFTQDRAAN